MDNGTFNDYISIYKDKNDEERRLMFTESHFVNYYFKYLNFFTLISRQFLSRLARVPRLDYTKVFVAGIYLERLTMKFSIRLPCSQCLRIHKFEFGPFYMDPLPPSCSWAANLRYII